MNITYHILKFLARTSSRGFHKNVRFSDLSHYIPDLLEQTDRVKYLTLFLREPRAVVVLTPRLYDIGKRLTLVLMATARKYTLLKKIQTELERSGTSSTIRMNALESSKRLYLRVDSELNEARIQKVLSAVILDTYQLDENIILDVEVATSEMMVLKEVASDPVFTLDK